MHCLHREGELSDAELRLSRPKKRAAREANSSTTPEVVQSEPTAVTVADVAQRTEPVAPIAPTVGERRTREKRQKDTRRAEEIIEDFINQRKVNIPEPFYEEIAKCHNTYVGHYGVENTLQRLVRKQRVWPRMRSHVTEFVRRCPACQKMTDLKKLIHGHPFTLSTFEPMAHLQIDTIGPLEEDEEGFVYIIVIIDKCTRYATLHAAKNVDARSAAEALIAHIGSVTTIPSTITSDNGSQYVNNLLTELYRTMLIDPTLTIAYSKQENAMVERANKEVMRHMRTYVFDLKSYKRWHAMLPLVQRIMNKNVHSSIGCAPADLLLSTAAAATVDMFPNAAANVGKWTGEVLKLQRKLLNRSYIIQHGLDNAHRQATASKVTDASYAKGSLVLVTYPETKMGSLPPTKFHPKLRGPYEVASSNGDAYTLKNLVTGKLENEVHISRLRAYVHDAMHSDPAKVAQTDDHEFDVEAILDHVGDPKRKSDMEFRVRWKGYGSEDDDWLPWKALRDNIYLHQYLRRVGLAKLIPKGHEQQDEEVALARAQMRNTIGRAR